VGRARRFCRTERATHLDRRDCDDGNTTAVTPASRTVCRAVLRQWHHRSRRGVRRREPE
jgi:hypothetical protein